MVKKKGQGKNKKGGKRVCHERSLPVNDSFLQHSGVVYRIEKIGEKDRDL